MEDERKHIAILGGGVGGCVAAYWLTATGELRKKYRVTLYQMGWRLGGKGASSRCAEKGQRSEEHGPHVWFGFYENAFRSMRGCMEEHARLGFSLGDKNTVEDSFEASREGVFYYEDSSKSWVPWKLELIDYPDKPGDGKPQPDVRENLWRMADHLSENLSHTRLLEGWTGRQLARLGRHLNKHAPATTPKVSHAGTDPEKPHEWASYLSRRLVELADDERVWYGEAVIGRGLRLFLDLLGCLIRREFRRADLGDEERRELCLADLYRTCLRGALVDVLIRDLRFEDLDDQEFQAWLRHHGAVSGGLSESPYLRGYYDTPFAYAGGRALDPAAANFAAGAALRGFFRIFFGYKGSYLYKMRLGMGECVFVPFYRVLKARGVKFEFFHRVERLVPNAHGNRVARVDFTRQAELREGVAEYDPIIEAEAQGVKWPVWPDKPIADQLEPGSLPAEGDPGLESAWSAHPGVPVSIHDRGADPALAGGSFDHLILAIPPGAHRRIAGELMEHSHRFRRMVETSQTIRTAAFQVWVSGAHDGLAWQGDREFREHELAGASPDPMNIILEATPILKTENTLGARHLLYLCCPVDDDPEEPEPGTDPGYPARQLAEAKARCLGGFEKYARLWPGVCLGDGTTLDPGQLYHPDAGAGPDERLDWQYFRVNIDPSERYVLSTNGSVPNRLHPWDSGFNNLVFAGDWCRNSIDIGCVESAATSGMLAAHEICGSPPIEDIAGLQYR